MMLDAIFERCMTGAPTTVMAQLGFERILDPSWLDELFEAYRGRQYERELLFSTVVDIVALVALGLQPSVHAAARSRESLRVSLSALYDKLNHSAPALGRALVQQSAQRLAAVDKTTEDGDTIVALLTNLPEEVTAVQVANLYRRRWTIESMFQKVESVLASEIKTLGYPRAALFSFCVALMGFNVLSLLQAAVESQHGIEPRSSEELSLYYVAGEVKRMHAGMMLALPAEHWSTLRDLPLDDFCALLLRIAAYAIAQDQQGAQATHQEETSRSQCCWCPRLYRSTSQGPSMKHLALPSWRFTRAEMSSRRRRGGWLRGRGTRRARRSRAACAAGALPHRCFVHFAS